jgi:hypothetical protein
VRFWYLSAPPPASALARRASNSASKVSYAMLSSYCPVSGIISPMKLLV